MRVIKRYELNGFNACQTYTEYCGVKVRLNFEDGNVVMKKSASLTTDNKFAQDAIENDPRFKNGNIKLVSEHTVEDDSDKKVAEPQTREVVTVEEVKTINDANSWFEENRGITLEKSTKTYVQDMCERYGVSFPNLRYK